LSFFPSIFSFSKRILEHSLDQHDLLFTFYFLAVPDFMRDWKNLISIHLFRFFFFFFYVKFLTNYLEAMHNLDKRCEGFLVPSGFAVECLNSSKLKVYEFQIVVTLLFNVFVMILWKLFFLAAQALQLPFASPYLKPHAVFKKGANFASAGSGLLDATNMGLVSISFMC
jgi:hypothetical protein